MTRPAVPHTPAAHDVIAAELARLTLGGRGPRRPELRLDWLGAIARTVRSIARCLTPPATREDRPRA